MTRQQRVAKRIEEAERRYRLAQNLRIARELGKWKTPRIQLQEASCRGTVR